VKIAIVTDAKNFHDFISHYQLPKEKFYRCSCMQDIYGRRVEFFVKIHTHLDLSDVESYLLVTRVKELTLEELLEKFKS